MEWQEVKLKTDGQIDDVNKMRCNRCNGNNKAESGNILAQSRPGGGDSWSMLLLLRLEQDNAPMADHRV
jgi:hypothetical protein